MARNTKWQNGRTNIRNRRQGLQKAVRTRTPAGSRNSKSRCLICKSQIGERTIWLNNYKRSGTVFSINCCKPVERSVSLKPSCNWKGQNQRRMEQMGNGEGVFWSQFVLPLAREFPQAMSAAERLARPPRLGNPRERGLGG